MSNKTSNKKFILGIAVAVLLPLAFYIYYTFKSDPVVRNLLPDYYIVDRVDSQLIDGKMEYDSVYHQVADIQLTNQLGEQVSLNKDLAGKIVAVNFFFVNCPSICPKLTGNVGMLQKAFMKNPKVRNALDTEVQFVSITVNPEKDSFPVLREYADSYKADHDRWWFLTGDRNAIYHFARHELRVSMQPGNGGVDDLIHSEKIVVLDKDRYIRGYYNGLDSIDLKRCADDIVILSREKKRKNKK